MAIFGFEPEKCFEYENGFYLTSDVKRLGKLLAHFELFKMISNLPGQIVECGVFKGASFMRFATFRDLFETSHSRKLIGFDIFGHFPNQDRLEDNLYAKNHDQHSGVGIAEADLRKFLELKNIRNYELIKGDINETVPDYVRQHQELKIALLHIDTDVYRPAMTALENFYDRVVSGGVIVLDDYAAVAGETKAVDEFFAKKDIKIQKLPYTHIPCYIVKP